MTCTDCGATVPPGAAWCGQCLAAAAGVPAAQPGRFVPAGSAPRRPQVLSRWRKTDTTFGPAGRLCWTVGVVLAAGFFVFSGSPFAIGGWCLIAGPMILRSVWRPGRVS